MAAGSSSILLPYFEPQSECCTLLAQYLHLDPAAPVFGANLHTLCTDPNRHAARCRQEFSYITQAAPFWLRFDPGSAASTSSFEQQCQQLLLDDPPPDIPCQVVTATSEASLRFNTTEDCCALVGGYASASTSDGSITPR